MNDFSLAKNRHSVRNYIKKPIDIEILNKLKQQVELVNKNGLNVQIVLGDSLPFDKFLISVPYIKNCENYLVMAGKNCDDLEEKIGYYGQKLVLFLQGMGLNSCWVAGTYNRAYVKADLKKDEKLVCVIAFGYGQNDGVPHKTKGFSYICKSMFNEIPLWFEKGVDCVLLAPSAKNQQKFRFEFLEPNVVKAYTKAGKWTKIDLGIAKYHFEIGAGEKNFVWYKPNATLISKIKKALKK